jgi:pyrroloquinoline quinone (PQQ) biosynthesis protein C
MEHLLAVRRRVIEELPATRMVTDLMEGRPNRDAYIRYLINVYNYAQFSPKVMAIAAARCMSAHAELATYLLRHAEEEQGHDRWALADLADLNVNEEVARAARPVPSCTALIGFVHYIAAHANPVGLFGWMYVLEAVGNDMGTPIAQRLKEWLGGEASRFVEGHGVADTDHTRELTEQIQSYVTADQDRADVDMVADVVADLYVRMFREVGGERPRWL